MTEDDKYIYFTFDEAKCAMGDEWAYLQAKAKEKGKELRLDSKSREALRLQGSNWVD